MPAIGCSVLLGAPLTPMTSFFREEGGGHFLLEAKRFEGEHFSDFHLRPSFGQTISLKGIDFVDCVVDGGRVIIRKGVSLEKIFFSNFTCGESLLISAECRLHDVKVSGKGRPSLLWIRPQEDDWVAPPEPVEPEVMVDVADFDGELSITGIPAACVRRIRRFMLSSGRTFSLVSTGVVSGFIH